MFIKEHPRLANEIARGSKRYNTIKNMRSGFEKANSTNKEDLKTLEKPKIITGSMANILAQKAAIALLLKRAFSFMKIPQNTPPFVARVNGYPVSWNQLP